MKAAERMKEKQSASGEKHILIINTSNNIRANFNTYRLDTIQLMLSAFALFITCQIKI